MHIRVIFFASLICFPALAQVSVDGRALEQLAPAQPAASQPAKPTKPATQAATVAKPAAPSTAQRPPVPPVATTTPPYATLPPPIAVPTRPAAIAAQPPVTADAPTSVERRKDGLRVVFGAGRSDLNAASAAEIEHLVQGDQSTAPTPDSASYTVTSFAPGTPEDASTPRRLSLSRALAVRSALMAKGVASVRIYVRALGPSSAGFADGPADRADIVVTANPVPPAASLPAASSR